MIGEWKLGGVEFMYPFTDSTAPIKLLNSLKPYDPPERNRPAAARKGEKWLVEYMCICSVTMVTTGQLTCGD